MNTTLPAAVAVPAGHLSLRLVAVTATVLAASHVWSRDVVALLLPVLSAALGFVADDFRILSFEFVSERGNSSIGAVAMLKHTIVLGGRAVVPDDVSVTMVGTTVGTVMQPLLVALVLVLAWPAGVIELALRLATACPLIAIVLLADTPLSMAAWLWDTQLRVHEPDRSSPLVWWNIFLNGGGRLALGLIVGVLSIAWARQRAGRLRNCR